MFIKNSQILWAFYLKKIDAYKFERKDNVKSRENENIGLTKQRSVCTMTLVRDKVQWLLFRP